MRLDSGIGLLAAIHLQPLDMAIIAGTLLIALSIGIYASRRSGKNSSEFFLSGRGMPWWMLGFSMVATTFAADTPNLVTDIVRTRGVAGNWVWWAFLLTGMLTVFNYARLWRKSKVLTDLEFYEIRYGGKMAAMLRGFRAIYLGVLFNVVVMSIVMLAAIKMGQVMLGLSPLASITAASLVTIVFSTLGGFRGVVLTDCFLFFLAMVGSIAAAVIAVNHPHVGGLEALFAHDLVKDKLDLIPTVDWNDNTSINIFVSILVVPLAVQWWSVWYPGSEPGGGGYLAQRMLAAKTPGHAVGATLLFNTAHYALRPWPWILVALASLVVFPDIESLRVAFPQVAEDKLGHDLAYPAMLTSMPTGWLGVVLASLLAAYMSTISTHLNWGSSYIVNDFYHRFIQPEASENELVTVGRISTIGMMLAAAILALYLQTASQGFQLVLQIGAGTGLIFILRWYWWRINAWAEVVAMTVSFVVALVMTVYGASLGLPDWAQLCTGILITNICWVLAAYLLPAESDETLESFCRLIRPGGSGWKPVIDRAAAAGRPIPPPDPEDNLPLGLLRMFFGCIAVYSALFATGMWLYGKWNPAMAITLLGMAAAVSLIFTYKKRVC